MTIFSGAGGDDAEDFARMLFEMYVKYVNKKGWKTRLIHENKNHQTGYRHVSIEIATNPSSRAELATGQAPTSEQMKLPDLLEKFKTEIKNKK